MISEWGVTPFPNRVVQIKKVYLMIILNNNNNPNNSNNNNMNQDHYLTCRPTAAGKYLGSILSACCTASVLPPAPGMSR